MLQLRDYTNYTNYPPLIIDNKGSMVICQYIKEAKK